MRGMKHLPTIRGWRQLCDVAEDFGFLPFLEYGGVFEMNPKRTFLEPAEYNEPIAAIKAAL